MASNTKITTTAIDGTDTIAGSRSTINDNFTLLANGINTLENFLDTDTKEISNIESIAVTKGSGSITDELITTNGTISAGGNIVANKSVVGDTAIFNNGLMVKKGNVTFSDPTGILSVVGDFSVGGAVIYSDFQNTSLQAADKLAFTTNNANNLVYSGSNTTIIGGLINTNSMNFLTVDWGSWVSAVDNRYFLDKLKIGVTGIPSGQNLRLMSLVGNNLEHEFIIMSDTLATYQDLTVGVKFTKNYQFLDLIFDGTNWIIINFSPGVTIE